MRLFRRKGGAPSGSGDAPAGDTAAAAAAAATASGTGISNPIHFQAPAVTVVRSTVVQDDAGADVALHTVKLEHEGWVWHVHLQWQQLKDLATALQRWRWRVFFLPRTIPPLPVINEGDAIRSPGQRHHPHQQPTRQHHRRRRSRDDWDLDDSLYLCEGEQEQEDGEPSVHRRGRGRGRGSEDLDGDEGGSTASGRQRRRRRRARSAPPVSGASSGEENEDAQADPADGEHRCHGHNRGEAWQQEHDEQEEAAAAARRRQERRDRRARRRWEYYSHRTSFSSHGKGGLPYPKMKDVSVPLTKAMAAATDPAVLAHQRTVYENYLRALLEDVRHRHCPKLLDLLQVSAHTFDYRQGPSFYEGQLSTACWWSVEEEEEALARKGGSLPAAAATSAEGGMDLEGLAVAMEGTGNDGRLAPSGGLGLSLPAALSLGGGGGAGSHYAAKRKPASAQQLTKCWAVLKHSFLAIYKDPRQAQPEAVLLFEPGTTLQAALFDPTAAGCVSTTRLALVNAAWRFELALPSLVPQRLWAAAIQSVLAQSPWVERSRFQLTRSLNMSYLDESNLSTAQWLVDGDAVYRSYEAAITGAKTSIFLAGAWVSPDVYLRRPPHEHPNSRLDRLLDHKAKEGVNVYVLLHQEPWGGNATIHARHTRARLMALPHAQGRIHVLLAGNDRFPHAWTHHENILAVDQEMAYVGATTLGLGQYDTRRHILKDDPFTLLIGKDAAMDPAAPAQEGATANAKGTTSSSSARRPTWPGRDYWNNLASDMLGAETAYTATDLPFHDRSEIPRLPQHTSAVLLTGNAARDVCWHFLQRWNLTRARQHATVLRLNKQGAVGREERKSMYPYPLPPALGPCDMWQMHMTHPLPLAPSMQATAAAGAAAEGAAAPTGAGQVAPQDGGVMARKTVARLLFGLQSSVALPPPRDELLTPAELAHKDALTALEEEASMKVRDWLRPAHEKARRRFLELQHDIGLSCRADLARYQAMIEFSLAPYRPPTHPNPTAKKGGKGQALLALPPTSASEDDDGLKRAGRKHRGRGRRRERAQHRLPTPPPKEQWVEELYEEGDEADEQYHHHHHAPEPLVLSHEEEEDEEEVAPDARDEGGRHRGDGCNSGKYTGMLDVEDGLASAEPSPLPSHGPHDGGDPQKPSGGAAAAIPTTDMAEEGAAAGAQEKVQHVTENAMVVIPTKVNTLPSTAREVARSYRAMASTTTTTTAAAMASSPPPPATLPPSPAVPPVAAQPPRGERKDKQARDRRGGARASGAQRPSSYHQYLHLRRSYYLKEAEDEEEAGVSMGPVAKCHARVVRSVGPWSAGVKQTETGVLEAYEQVIANAQHYVYLEGPFFISGLRGDTEISNRVAEVLLNRIVQAHDRRQRFRALVLLPLLPVYDGPLHGATSTMLTSALYYQLTSVRRLLAKLREMMIPDPSEYIQFLSLRTFARMNGRPDPATGASGQHYVCQQIYVNSRVLIADDRHCVLGSAAVNERSLVGGRDSELCVVLEDIDPVCPSNPSSSSLAHCEMDGRPYQAGAFARTLRLRLWGEHLCLLNDYVRCRVVQRAVAAGEGEGGIYYYQGENRADVAWDASPEDAALGPILDPVAPETWAFLKETARRNSAIFAHVFPCAVPSDAVTSLDALKQVIVERTKLPATLDFVKSVLGKEQAQDEEALLDGFLHQRTYGSAATAPASASGCRSAYGDDDEDEIDCSSLSDPDEDEEVLRQQLRAERRATGKWLRRLRGHLVQFPTEFLRDDLAALRPLNGLQGWVM